jgi:cell wall-associated NlpC family hydrolase
MQWCFDKAIGIQLPWDSRRQAVYGQAVELEELRTGDLLFFDTNGDGVINHVGMYIDKDIMLHTNNPTAKINYITFASGSYWRNKFVNARRVIQ